MRVKYLFELVKRKLKGSLRCAIEEGMLVEKGVTVMGGVNFGSEPYLIHLKQNCRISFDVAFVTHDGGTWAFRNSWPEYKNVCKFGKIIVGEYSFIGARSVIMPNVTIGNNSVVGAGSIVLNDVPDGTVVAGVPAKPICSIHEYAEKCKSSMGEDFCIEKYEQEKKDYLKTYFKCNSDRKG